MAKLVSWNIEKKTNSQHCLFINVFAIYKRCVENDYHTNKPNFIGPSKVCPCKNCNYRHYFRSLWVGISPCVLPWTVRIIITVLMTHTSLTVTNITRPPHASRGTPLAPSSFPQVCYHKEGSPFDPTPTPVLTLNESHHREIDWNVICKFVYILSISLSSSHLLVWVSQ